jgi:hypothetical protein
MVFSFPGPLGEHFNQQRMSAQRFAQMKRHTGEAFPKLPADVRQVPTDVDSGRQEIWDEQETAGSSRYAACCPLFDSRLRQLQK